MDPLKDNLDFIPGMIGSYPNLFIDTTRTLSLTSLT